VTEKTTTRSARAVTNDPGGMMKRIAAFPEQLRGAFELAERGPDLLAGSRPERIFVVGMGGSAIGGDFLRSWAEESCPTPVEVVRGYELPASCSSASFAFFVSYSGNTEETLSCFEEALARRVVCACVTSGGRLAERARERGVPVLRIPGGSPPRAALGWTSVPLFHALAGAGLARFGAEDLEAAARACEEALAAFAPGVQGNALLAWAESAAKGFPVIYAPARPYAACAVRWACQLNENGKTLAHVALFPEQNHNEIVGWEAPSPLHALARVAFLTGEGVHPRVRKRMELVAKAVEAAGARATWFEARGGSAVARLYSFATMGDLASVFTAQAKRVDPTPVASIDRLKTELGSAG
jgi:glucose/mannose-6-phosphate isomerase